MSWPLSVLAAFLTAVLGLFAGGAVMAACVRWYRVSNFEGGAGFAVVFAAFFSAIAAGVIGLFAARHLGGEGFGGFLRGLGWSCGISLGIALVAAGIAWALADIPPEIDGKELMLEVEVRLPVTVTESPAKGTGDSWIDLGSVVNHRQRASERGTFRPADARFEAGRWIVPGEVHLFTTRGLRALGFQLNGESLMGFMVPLPARPGRASLAWSDWGPKPPPPSPPWPDTNPSYRFRVKPIEPPPPPPSEEELAAEKAAEEKARFDAMDPDAGVAAWIVWTRYGVADAYQATAIRRIGARTTLAEELRALALSEDRDAAQEALRIIERLENPPTTLLGRVAEVGRDVAERIRKFNATTPEDDPSYEGAADVSVRFSAWMTAVRTLRERCGGDFTPELKEILVLSRVRSDSIVMRGDVLRVASYWTHEWTGLAPLPTDPPPR